MTEKVKAPSLRQRMVKGTKWKLTADAALSSSKQITYKDERGFPCVDQILEPRGVLPAGTEITITGKARAEAPGPGWYYKGIWFPVTVNGVEDFVEFKELNKNPEQIGEAEAVPEFVIWDTEKQAYYTGHEYKKNAQYRTDSEITYDAKLSKAKKFKRLADVRAHALVQSGYYYDLPESWGSVPEWMLNSKTFNVPDTWEIVKYDKLSKKEIERIELVTTYKRSWKLRDLTVKYSSAVRQVYSELDKKKKLGDYSAVMMFKKAKDCGNGYWAEELLPTEVADINNLMGRFGDDVKIQKNTVGFAVAVKDAMTATMIRLAYMGELECVIIDFATMDEVVNKE